jgi:hypothetical protein
LLIHQSAVSNIADSFMPIPYRELLVCTLEVVGLWGREHRLSFQKVRCHLHVKHLTVLSATYPHCTLYVDNGNAETVQLKIDNYTFVSQSLLLPSYVFMLLIFFSFRKYFSGFLFLLLYLFNHVLCQILQVASKDWTQPIFLSSCYKFWINTFICNLENIWAAVMASFVKTPWN